MYTVENKNIFYASSKLYYLLHLYLELFFCNLTRCLLESISLMWNYVYAFNIVFFSRIKQWTVIISKFIEELSSCCKYSKILNTPCITSEIFLPLDRIIQPYSYTFYMTEHCFHRHKALSQKFEGRYMSALQWKMIVYINISKRFNDYVYNLQILKFRNLHEQAICPSHDPDWSHVITGGIFTGSTPGRHRNRIWLLQK